MSTERVRVDGTPYVPTPEEQRVLEDCRFNAAMRGAVYSSGGLLLAYPMLKRSSGGRFGLWHRVVLGITGVTSFTIGMFSYSSRCAEQLMALDDSPMGDSLRKAIEEKGFSVERMSNASRSTAAQHETQQEMHVDATSSGGAAMQSWDQEWSRGVDDTRTHQLDTRDDYKGVTSQDAFSHDTSSSMDASSPVTVSDAFSSRRQPTHAPDFFDQDRQESLPTKLTYDEIRRRNRAQRDQSPPSPVPRTST